MIAVGETMDASLWNRTRIQVRMRRRRGLIVESVVSKDWDARRKPRTQVGRRFQVLARPTALADKGGRDQEYRAKLAP